MRKRRGGNIFGPSVIPSERERDCFGGVFLLLALCVGVDFVSLSLSLFYKLRVLRLSLSLSLSSLS